MAVCLKSRVAPKCSCCQELPRNNRKPKLRRAIRRTEKQAWKREVR